MSDAWSGVSVFLFWLSGCFVGGMLAALGLYTEFFGYLIVFGILLAVGQVGFVARYLGSFYCPCPGSS